MHSCLGYQVSVLRSVPHLCHICAASSASGGEDCSPHLGSCVVDEQLLERVGADVLEADDVEQHEVARLLAPLASRRGRGEVRVEPEHEEVEDVLVEVARQRVARLGGLARRERDLAR